MIGWRICRIPTITDSSSAGCDLLLCIRRILYSLQNSEASNAGIELLFHHGSGESVSVYLFLHNIRNNGLVSTIEMQLNAASYQVEFLNDPACSGVYAPFMHSGFSEKYAIIKTEKIVTTPYIPEGYYYWADSLMHKSDTVNNLTLLFQALQNYDHSYVAFQLQPTVLESYEYDTLQYLSAFLDHRVKNPLPGNYGMPIYEPYALPAYDAYSNIVSQRGQPLFVYNILISSLGQGGFNLASQISAMIKAETSNASELQVLSLSGMPSPGNDADGYIHAVSNHVMQYCRDNFIWGGNLTPPNTLFRMPFLVTAAEAEVFFKLPYDDGKITGISGTAFQSSNELLHKSVTDESNIQFGYSLSNRNINIGASAKDFAKHALIVGMPGTGKTTFAINLLMQFYRKGIPFLAIEPTKTEYRAMIDAVDNLQVFTPGNNAISPFVLNPFIPPNGITVEQYVPSLFSAFRAAFSMPSPLDSAFLKAIRASYVRYGWRDYSTTEDPDVTPFGMHEFIIVFKELIAKMDYGKEVKGNLQSGGVLRLSNLIEQNRNIFDTVHSIPIEDLLKNPTVIELNAVDNQEQKALIIAMLLINLGAYIKTNQNEETELNNVVLIDEAHVLLGQKARQNTGNDGADSQTYAVQLVENLIAEIRSYGTSVIIADQRPSAVGSAIVANTDIKVVFRLTERYEKEIICASADFDESMQRQLSQLEMGQAFVYYNKLIKPQLVQTPDIRKEENIRIKVASDEVKQKNTYWTCRQDKLRPYLSCTYCKHADAGCNHKIRADAEYYASLLWDRASTKITDVNSLLLYCNGVPIALEGHFQKYDSVTRETIIICTRIALIRKAAIEKSILLKPKQAETVLSSAEVRR